MSRILNKKNGVWILLILIIVLFGLVVFQKRRIVEGFGFGETIYSFSIRPINNINDSSTRQGNFRGRSFIAWNGPSKTMPDSVFNPIQEIYNKYELYDRMFEYPSDYVRVDTYSLIPYASPNNALGCDREWESKTLPDMGSFKYFTQKPDWIVNNMRRMCNIQITPEYLGSFPPQLQEKLSNFIASEQKAIIDGKRQRIRDAKRVVNNCAARKKDAESMFSPELRNAYEAKKQKDIRDLQVATVENIKKDANTTLQDIAKETGTTTANILADPALRTRLKLNLTAGNLKAAAVNQLRPSPYAVVNTALKSAGIDLLKGAMEGIFKVLTGDPFAGTECPIGFTEIQQINTDPTFQRINEIFPNPFADFINIGATTKACAKYEPGKPPEIKPKICDDTYVLAPEPMKAKPPAAVTNQCEMDKDITKKLQLISDWVIDYSLTNSLVVSLILNFQVIRVPNEYLIETTFEVQDYSKDSQFALKDGRLTPRETKRMNAKFFFTKSGCTYAVFGYSSENLDFTNQFKINIAQNINFAPKPSDMFLLWQYAIEEKRPNPVEYATRNKTNQNEIGIAKKFFADRAAREQAERKEREDLLKFLNPKNDETINFALSKSTNAELKERKGIFEKYKYDATISINHLPIERLRAKVKDEETKIEIVKIFNPTNNPILQTSLLSLSLGELQERQRNKASRDSYIATLNPTNDPAKRIELERLSTTELNKQDADVKEKRFYQETFNPSNNPQTAAILNQLTITELKNRLTKLTPRKDAIRYFNPTDSDSILTRLLEVPVAELNEKMTLIKQLNPKTNEEIQNLYLMTLDALRIRVDPNWRERQTFMTYFGGDDTNIGTKNIVNSMKIEDLRARKNLIDQMKDKNTVSTRRFWLNPTVPLSELQAQVDRDKCIAPPGNDCWKNKSMRRNCPACWP